MLGRIAERLARHRATIGAVPPSGVFGSNAWAVSGAHTTDGATLLAGDGHLELTVPSLFFQLGLDTRALGDGDISLLGGWIPGIPVMGVGTNGHVAWSQTRLMSDELDHYREELRLDGDGVPDASRFEGEWRPLVVFEDTYEVANVPLLMSPGRTESRTLWSTFDGRMILEIEGDPVEGDAPDGAYMAQTVTGRVVPCDVDGAVVAVSMDFAAYDVGDLERAVDGFSEAGDVDELRAATRGLIS